MPVVTVTLIEGYDDDTKRGIERRLTDAIKATIDAPMDGITVIVNEVAPSNYMRGRTSRTPGAPSPPAAELVRAFLDAMEARDLAKAEGFLAEGFTMTFPGGASFTKLDELVAWAEPRYRFVKKSYQRVDEAVGEAGVVVYCSGTLSGEWRDGTPFEGIRFIDRFTVAGGKLVDQMVWNDMGEAKGAQSEA
ncbi:MAG: tautomerase family protein [Alphaproteobacteria bacterium]|nr:tautomerase family protein [Alphaproteobacteria bacterium]